MKLPFFFKYSVHVIILSLAFVSCKTTKVYDPVYDVDFDQKQREIEELVKQEQINYKGEQRELSQKLGIEIGKDDNLALYKEVANWLGVPYRYGGSNKNGVDCSGLVCQIYLTVYDKKLHRSSANIYDKNCRKIKKSQLETGDLVFFATGKSRSKVNHVGIYLKDRKFVHSSSSRGVVISNIDEKYFVRTYVSCGRVEYLVSP